METRLEEDEENEDYEEEEEEEDNEEAEENQMSTVVCGLYSHVQEPSLLPVIEYAADQMTKIAFEGSRLLNLTVLSTYLKRTNHFRQQVREISCKFTEMHFEQYVQRKVVLTRHSM